MEGVRSRTTEVSFSSAKRLRVLGVEEKKEKRILKPCWYGESFEYGLMLNSPPANIDFSYYAQVLVFFI